MIRHIPVTPHGEYCFGLAADTYAEAVANVRLAVTGRNTDWIVLVADSEEPLHLRTWGGLRRHGWRIREMQTALTVIADRNN